MEFGMKNHKSIHFPVYRAYQPWSSILEIFEDPHRQLFVTPYTKNSEAILVVILVLKLLHTDFIWLL
ncbi:MAG: hypothetical protein ACI9N3_002704 [Colwellia sp.]|jgi:hypothetical protein